MKTQSPHKKFKIAMKRLGVNTGRIKGSRAIASMPSAPIGDAGLALALVPLMAASMMRRSGRSRA